MEISDIELIESLPIGIIIDSDIKILDKFGYSFSLSGIDFETCVTLSCVKEIIRFSPIKIILSSREFVGGTIAQIVDLSKTSDKKFKIALWTDKKLDVSDDEFRRIGICGQVNKTLPFSRILKKVKEIMIS